MPYPRPSSVLVTLEREQGMNAVAECRQACAAAEIGQIDEEARLDDDASYLLYKLDSRGRGAAGRDQVVDQEHALPLANRIYVHLDAVSAVLQLVVVSD